ncbi:MAG: P-loop NTPase fold protein [Crocosphaera sp.]
MSSNDEIYRKILNATSPAVSIDFDDVEKQKYYVNPSSSRGGSVIQEMLNSITNADGERYTLQVLTGHIGCGKTTELKYLKHELEKEDFTVVFISLDEYFKGQYNIETLTALDVLYLIGAKIIEKHDFSISAFFDNVVNRLGDLLPQIREVAVQPEVVTPIKGIKAKFLLRVITEARNNETAKGRFRTYLNGIKDNLVEAINQELETLKNQVEIQKVAIIIDDLDRRRDKLRELFGSSSNISMLNNLNCHTIYTIPLEVKYRSNLRTEIVNYHVKEDIIKILPMISIWDRQTPSNFMTGSLDREALKLLKKVVLRRAFSGNEYTEDTMIQEGVK